MSKYKYGIVIPTCAEPGILIESVPRFFNFAEDNTIIIFSFNPKDMDKALQTEQTIKFFYSQIIDRSVDYEIVWSGNPIGFGCAVNKGTKYLEETHGLPEYIIIANDDLEVTQGWMKSLSDSFNAKTFTTRSKLVLNEKDKEKAQVDIGLLGSKIGMVGPMSNGVFNDQSISAANKEYIKQIGIDAYAHQHRQVNNNALVKTTFLSGYCFMISKECFLDMKDKSFEHEGLFDTRFEVGGYEDDDLCVRMNEKGWSLMIDATNIIGHKVSQTLNMHFSENRSGLANGIEFLLKWEDETQKDKNIVSAYRTALKCVNDVNQFHNSVLRASQLLDGIVVLLTNNPKDVLKSYDQMMVKHLPIQSQKFIKECSEIEGDMNDSKEKLKTALLNFLEDVLPENYPIEVDVWTGEFNERDERNKTHEMAEKLNPDYIMSIDSDEIFEDRITKDHIQRIVKNPNPMRDQFSVSFLNHWENMKIIREDKHYASMTGIRLWKSYKNPLRIFSGNDIGFHCGNSPELGNYGRRISSIRMRHLSHVRRVDRDHKANFYNTIDKDKRVELVGSNDYNHINQENDVKVSIYNPNNGIALTMLCYSAEDWVDYQIWFDQMYSIADRICLVWTEGWSEEDQDWIKDYSLIKDMDKKSFEDKYKTGPSWEMAQLSRLYKVEWVHEELDPNMGLARCRNAGIDYLHNTNDGSLGWVVFLDPDEMPMDFTRFQLEMILKANRTDNYGYMFRFSNPTSSGKVSGSESIRMVQLNDFIRLSGVVHETFEHSFNRMKSQGVHPKVIYFDNKLLNRGLSKSPEQMANKLLKYRDMLCKQLEINPFHSPSWVALALQYLNDDDFEYAEKCFIRAMACSNGAYLPFKEYSFFLLRKAQVMLIEAHNRTNSSHNFYNISKHFIETIQKWGLDLPKVDTGGISISDTTTLPSFPSIEEIQKMQEGKIANENVDKNEESEVEQD